MLAVVLRMHWLYGVAAVTWALVFGCCYPQSYEMAGDCLIIRAGLTKRTIPYGTISAVSHSTNSGSALALSLDRVLIVAANTEVLIAP